MIKLQSKSNVNAPSIPYPYGSLRDNPGDNTGTPVNTVLLGDTMQLMEKIMAESGITPNGLPDNQSNGWQLYEALIKVTKPAYKSYVAHLTQSGTSAPIVVETFSNEIGTPTLSYLGVGIYQIAFPAGSFPTGAFCMISQGMFTFPPAGFLQMSSNGTANIQIYSFNASGVASDNIMKSGNIEIRVYS